MPSIIDLRRSAPALARGLAAICLIAWGEVAAHAQQSQRPPDFSQPDIGAAADEVSASQKAWRQSARNLEQEVFRMSMADARRRVQGALTAALTYLDQRARYAEKVAGSIERSRAGGNDRKPLATVEVVSRDELDVLDFNLTDLVAKLDVLRSSPQEWVRIRRGVQADQTAVTTLQSKLREDIPADTLFNDVRPKPVSTLIYRDSEMQLRDVLQKTWVHYYQSVIDAIEQKPGGSTPLITLIPGTGNSSGVRESSTPALAASAAPVPPATPAFSGAPAPQTVSSAVNILAGEWRYVEGTEQFNGVGEPHQVLLELWVEDGALLGRYRAELPDFDGARKVDLRLRGKTGKAGQTVLQIQSGDPMATGEFVIEDTGSGGLSIMLVRSVAAGGPVPRGRELLTRR